MKHTTPTTDPGPLRPTENAMDVHRWLAARGYRISKSQLYEHVRVGMLARDEGGMFTEPAVNAYVVTWLARKAGGAGGSPLAEARLSAEVRLKSAQAAREELRLEIERGEWVRRDDVESEQVGRAAILDAGWDYVFHNRAGELVALLRQPGAGVPEAIAWLKQFKEDLLARYAAPFEFEVLGLDDDDPEDDHEGPARNLRATAAPLGIAGRVSDAKQIRDAGDHRPPGDQGHRPDHQATTRQRITLCRVLFFRGSRAEAGGSRAGNFSRK